jgi:hypothetical protein
LAAFASDVFLVDSDRVFVKCDQPETDRIAHRRGFVRGFFGRIDGHPGYGGLAASNEREGDAMTRTLKLVTLGVLGAWLLTSTSCDDKVCNDALQTSKKEATEQRKESASNLAKLAELKTQLAAAEAKVDNLTKENDELKAKNEAAVAKGKGKSKSKVGKAKHKHKGKK